ncbi:MAG: energy-coupling factor ABC transporter ATP-binding protein [Candidatus Promineifilaceae bacterium]
MSNIPVDIIVDQVTFAYSPEVVALREVSLTVEQGETVAIVGENGAGKSTLAKHLNGLLRPSSGTVTVGGWDTRQHTPGELAARVGFAFQNPDDQLFKRSVESEVAFGPENLGFSESEVQEAVAGALAATGLTDDADKHPHDLHSSLRRMVALAATLAMRTPVVVIDEPTIGQDANGIAQLSDIIGALHQDGRTVIAISHNIDFCAANFRRIVVMAGGRILADGPAAEVFQQKEILAEAHVEPPQLLRLADALGLSLSSIDLDAFLARLDAGAQRTA